MQLKKMSQKWLQIFVFVLKENDKTPDPIAKISITTQSPLLSLSKSGFFSSNSANLKDNSTLDVCKYKKFSKNPEAKNKLGVADIWRIYKSIKIPAEN